MGEPRITKEMLIGEVLREYPESLKVFKRYFGGGCFDCPGQDHEDIEFGSVMHNADMAAVLKELNEVAEKRKK